MLLESRTLKNSDLSIANNIDLWDRQFKKGVLASEVFSGASGDDIDFSNFNTLSTSAAVQMAACLPHYDQNFTVFA